MGPRNNGIDVAFTFDPPVLQQKECLLVVVRWHLENTIFSKPFTRMLFSRACFMVQTTHAIFFILSFHNLICKLQKLKLLESLIMKLSFI